MVKTSNADDNTSAKMIISTTGNDENKNQALTIDDDGSVGVGTTHLKQTYISMVLTLENCS